MLSCVAFTHQLLGTVGVPENQTLLLFITAVIVTLASYWSWLFGITVNEGSHLLFASLSLSLSLCLFFSLYLSVSSWMAPLTTVT
jgi:hypothetical protein